jgi:protein-disulfide isomerase
MDMTTETKFIGSIGILTMTIMVGGIFLFSRQPTQTAVLSASDTAILTRNATHAIKAKNTKVTVVEFADFQCPACAAAHPIVKEVLEKYKGKITFIYRHFPLNQHKNARLAARAAEAANNQGKFWEMHDMLYENQKEWSESSSAKEVFTGYAKVLGLNNEIFEKAINSTDFDDAIQHDYVDGVTLGVNSTPTFFLNGNKLQSFGELSTAIQEALSYE